MAIHMKPIERNFLVVLFGMLPYKVMRTFESVGEALVCYHSSESY